MEELTILGAASEGAVPNEDEVHAAGALCAVDSARSSTRMATSVAGRPSWGWARLCTPDGQ